MELILAVSAIGIALFALLELRIAFGFWRLSRRSVAVAKATVAPENGTDLWPTVLVQLPIFNEPGVALQLINAVAKLDYPRDRISIQVLDDSTDETVDIIAARLAAIDPDGALFKHVRRPERIGYKAGALQHGLEMSSAEYIAIFDADFLPPADFLKRALLVGSPFEDQEIAFVQGRWTYYNSDANLLTRVQSILMDRHFFLQKPFQHDGGRTLHFNGSGGVWRRRAIEDAGGWMADTLCEDLDLSYRCALIGYRGIYDASLVCPSEIPQSITAFKLQQRRWSKGSAQVAAKLLPAVLRSDQLGSRVDDVHVLLGYMIHPLLLIYTLIWPWSVMFGATESFLWSCQVALILGNVAAFVGFMYTFRARNGVGRSSLRGVGDVIASMIIGVALMVNNSVAFLSGMFAGHGIFERTPKSGVNRTTASRPLVAHWTIWLECALAVYGLTAGMILFAAGHTIWGQQSFFMGCAMAFVVTLQIYPKSKRNTPTAQVPAE